MKNIVLLDIDGVIAPIYSIPHNDYFEIITDYTTWQIPFQNIDYMIDILFKTDNSQIIWASAWEEQSNLVNNNTGLPEFEYIQFSEGTKDWLKEKDMESFIHHHQKHNNIIWIDDEIPDWLFDKYSEMDSVNLVKPDGRIGLTDEEWKNIHQLLA